MISEGKTYCLLPYTTFKTMCLLIVRNQVLSDKANETKLEHNIYYYNSFNIDFPFFG